MLNLPEGRRKPFPQPKGQLPPHLERDPLTGQTRAKEPDPIQVSETDVRRLKLITAELVKREMEALRLYEPLPLQGQFHACTAKKVIVRGSNRSGKTLSACVEVARAVCGMDPYHKYPLKDGRCFVVGRDLKHIAHTIWPTLGKPGAFKMIRDLETGKWRAFRPLDPTDVARKHEARRAPPLLAPRFVPERNVAWLDKKAGIPTMCTVNGTGWEIHFLTAQGKPPKGTVLDLAHFDEEIPDEDWYPETAARLLDRSGRFIWSCTPEEASDELLNLHERAESNDQNVAEFHLLLADNPHLPEEEKRELAADMSDERFRVKILGEYAITGYKVYPEFEAHYRRIVVPNREIPRDWTRYMIVDPGRQVLAVLFAAVPPPSVGDFVYLYDQLYIRNASVGAFGEQVASRVGNDPFEAFIIDMHGARVHEQFADQSIHDLYSRELKKRGIKSRLTGHELYPGSDDVKARIEATRTWLRVRDDETCKLQVLEGRLPDLEREIKRYRYKKKDGILTDDPVARNNHLVNCVEYIAAFGPKYHKPTAVKPKKPGIEGLMEQIDKLERRGGLKKDYVRLGAGGP